MDLPFPVCIPRRSWKVMQRDRPVVEAEGGMRLSAAGTRHPRLLAFFVKSSHTDKYRACAVRPTDPPPPCYTLETDVDGGGGENSK